jgi:hypothetical protein
VDGSDPTHVNEEDFHQRKKIKPNEGSLSMSGNVK